MSLQAAARSSHHHQQDDEDALSFHRRLFVSTALLWMIPTSAIASDSATTTALKEFRDPKGLFSIRVPSDFFTLRRSNKGDLPDEQTGAGRRGSSIFTAGNMAKAEVIAVERCVACFARLGLVVNLYFE